MTYELKKVIELQEIINNEYKNIVGLIVMREGEKVYENYFNGGTSTNIIHIASATKSIISILIGIAIDKGYIKSIDQKVLDFFPNYTVKRGEKNIQNVTLRNMITMTAPFKFKSEPYTKFFASDDWVNATLDLLGGKGKIGEFRYTPIIGPDILSGILVNTTGQPVLDFATENLFSPLGIKVERNVILHNKDEHMAFLKGKNMNGWVVDPKGTNTAGWGLNLTPVDMAKIGQLYLDGGVWNKRQLVSAQWIDESTKEHSRWNELSYGYLWWIENGKGYSAIGDGGNVIYISKEKKIVISIASLFMPRAKDRIELIKEHIEPIFDI